MVRKSGNVSKKLLWDLRLFYSLRLGCIGVLAQAKA